MADAKYTDIAAELEKNILAGMYGWSGGLPAVSDLSTTYGARVNTVKRAMTLLEGKNLIEKRGIGYYVNRVPYPMTQYMPPIVIRMKEQDKTGYIKNVGTVERITLPARLASKANANTVNAVLQRCILGDAANGKEYPTQYTHYYFLLPMSDEQLEHMQQDPSIDPLIENNTTVLVKRQDEIVSRQPTQEEATILNTTRASSVLGVISIVRDEDNNLLLIQEDVLSPRLTLMYDYSFENRPKS